MKIADLNFADIKEGQVYQFTKKITHSDVLEFANLTGDFNPLHVDDEFGKKSQFKQNIIHGMLAGSLFSALIGMNCPGKKALYLSQTLNFKVPLFYGDTVIVRGTVIAKNRVIHLITLKTEIIKKRKACVYGKAKVRVLENYYG